MNLNPTPGPESARVKIEPAQNFADPSIISGEHLCEISIKGDVPLDRARLKQANEALLQCVFKGQEPDLTPLIEREASLITKLNEYNDLVLARTFRPRHSEHPIAWVLGKVGGLIEMFLIKARRDYANNVDNIRDCNIQKVGNEKAFAQIAACYELIKQGKIENALECFDEAMKVAPHRAEDIYRDLGSTCLALVKWKKDLRFGIETIQADIEETLDWTHPFTASLSSSVIEVPYSVGGHDENGSSVEPVVYARSRSGVHFRGTAEQGELHFQALAQALLSATLPLEEIGIAAFEREVYYGELSKRRETYMSLRSPYANQAAIANILWLQGDYENAAKFSARTVAEESRISHRTPRGLEDITILSLRDMGKLSEAVDSFGKSMLEYGRDGYERFESFMNLCELCVQHEAKQENKWDIALPYLEELQKQELEILDHVSNPAMAYYLALAYVETGHKAEAGQQLELLHELLTDKIRVFHNVIPSSSRYVKRIHACLYETNRMMENIS